MQYKFRAECMDDVSVFLHNNRKNHDIIISPIFTKPIDDKLPDVEVVFDSDLSLEKIIELMREVQDGHVMCQTVKPIKEYTGERNYDL